MDEEIINRIENMNQSQDVKEIFESYVYEILNEKTDINEKTKNDYIRVVLLFLENVGKRLEDVRREDIKKYCEQQLTSDSRRNFVIPNIADFVSYCKKNKLQLIPSEQEILKLKVSSKERKKTNPPRAITANDVMDIRESLLKSEAYRELVTFELLFSFGLKERQLLLCNDENYDLKKHAYIFEDKELVLPQYLADIVEKHSEKIYRTYNGERASNYKSHIKKAGEKINQNLKISDITKTHELLSVSCPFCGQKYPVEETYWVMKKIEKNQIDSFWLKCKHCSKEELENINEK